MAPARFLRLNDEPVRLNANVWLGLAIVVGMYMCDTLQGQSSPAEPAVDARL